MRRRDELEAGELRRRNEIEERVTLAKAEHQKAERQVKELAAVMET